MRPTRAPSTIATESAAGSRSKIRTTFPIGVSTSSQRRLVTRSAIVRGDGLEFEEEGRDAGIAIAQTLSGCRDERIAAV
jgi:hypothetical protein